MARDKDMILHAADYRVVDGPVNAECLVRVPDSPWILTTGMISPSHSPGHLYAVHTGNDDVVTVYPRPDGDAPDADTFGDVAPPSPEAFNAHGAGLQPGEDGDPHTLYVVNHGREAVEVFSVAMQDDQAPTLTWVGFVSAPEGAELNNVSVHPHGGFVVTNLCQGGRENYPALWAGEITGTVLRWEPGSEMTPIPGTELNAPNGVEVSPDGEWLFIALWAKHQIMKLSLTNPDQAPVLTSVDCCPDNFIWTEDGTKMTVLGQFVEPQEMMQAFPGTDRYDCGFQVLEVDPESLEVVVLGEFDDSWAGPSTALAAEDAIWVASARSTSLLVVPSADL